MCPPCHKEVVTNQIFHFLLSLRGITQNPQTQPKHSAPFPSTHDPIYCFLMLSHSVFLTWQLLCHFEWLGYQLHNCHQRGLSSWFLKTLPMKKRLPLVSLVYFTFIFLTPLFSGLESWQDTFEIKWAPRGHWSSSYLSCMTHHILKGFNPKRARGEKKMLWKWIVGQQQVDLFFHVCIEM